MEDRALRSSWRETKGQRNQLMTIALTVPTRKATPRDTAMNAGSASPSDVTSDKEMTVNVTQPAIPERYSQDFSV